MAAVAEKASMGVERASVSVERASERSGRAKKTAGRALVGAVSSESIRVTWQSLRKAEKARWA